MANIYSRQYSQFPTDKENKQLQQDLVLLTDPQSSLYQVEHTASPQRYGKGNRRGLIFTVLSASLTMALINGLHPPKAPPVRIVIKKIIC